MVNVMRQRGGHVDLSLPEAADRLAISELIDAYAYCADRRDVAGQLALFTEDGSLSFLPTAEILSRPRDFGDARRWPRYSTNSKTTRRPCISMVKAQRHSTAFGPPR